MNVPVLVALLFLGITTAGLYLMLTAPPLDAITLRIDVIPKNDGDTNPVIFSGVADSPFLPEDRQANPEGYVQAELRDFDGLLIYEADRIPVTKDLRNAYTSAFNMEPHFPDGRYTITVFESGAAAASASFIYERDHFGVPEPHPCEGCPGGKIIRGFDHEDGAIHIQQNQDVVKLIPALLRFPPDNTKAADEIIRRCAAVTYDEDDGQEKIPGFVIAEIYCVRDSINRALIARELVTIWTEFCASSEFSGSDWAAPECSKLINREPGVDNLVPGDPICPSGTELAGGLCVPLAGTCEDCISGTITRVVDGDTVHIDGQSVRLALVNTPERGRPGFSEATGFTEQLCPPGSAAELDLDAGQAGGSYGRVIGEVYCGGRSLNAALVYSGHAVISVAFCARSEFATQPWAAACQGREPRFETPVINPPMPAEPEAPVIALPTCEEGFVIVAGVCVEDVEVTVPNSTESLDIANYEDFAQNPFDPRALNPTPVQLILIAAVVMVGFVVLKFRK